MRPSTQATSSPRLRLKALSLAFAWLLLNAASAPCASAETLPSPTPEQPEKQWTLEDCEKEADELTWHVEFLKDKAVEDEAWCKARVDSLQRRLDNPEIEVPSQKSTVVPIVLFIGGFVVGTVTTVGIYKALD